MVSMNQHSDTSDEALIPLIVADQAVFAVLVERYEAKLKRYIYRIANVNKEDCEDLLQEIFIKVYKNLNGFDTSLSFSSWIYRIAHNHVRSHYRKLQARPKTSEIDDTIIENIPGNLDLELAFDKELSKDILLKALSKLDEKYRNVLVLKFLEEKDYNEIADIIQKPKGTVGTLINRAKKKLKKELEKSYE